MIKHINHQNFLTTPFVAAKSWRLHNDDPDDLVLLEPTGSDDTVALEYTDYSTDNPFVNTACSIALEQQNADFINYQEGITGSGKFYPDQEPTNQDGTFKRLVHAQTKAAFYNKNNDPTKIFGMEFIDFPLGQTFRDLSAITRLFNVPQSVFGERILEKSVRLNDSQLDDNVEVVDDGYQNLIATRNLFSKVQEVKSFGNIIMSGTSSYECYADHVDVSITEGAASISIGFVSGELLDIPTIENTSFSMTFYTGSLDLGIITSSAVDTASLGVAFYTGSLNDNVLGVSGSYETGSLTTTFYTGSLFDQVLITSGSTTESSSMNVAFYTGSMFDQVVTSSMTEAYASASINVGFLSGALS